MEYKELKEHGLAIDNVKIQIAISHFVCDAVTRQHIKQNEPKVFIGTKRKTSAPGTASPSEFCKRKLQEPAELVGRLHVCLCI